MKYLALLALVASTIFFNSCAPEAEENKQIEASTEVEFISQNIAFFDARLRSMDETKYVKEIVLTNFGTEAWDKEAITYKSTVYTDNGEGFDLVKGDGVFTSEYTYMHDQKHPYDAKHTVVSVMSQPLVHTTFQHQAALKTAGQQYELRQGDSKLIEVTCPVEFGTCGCYADEWGLCNCCCVTIHTDDCEVTIGI